MNAQGVVITSYSLLNKNAYTLHDPLQQRVVLFQVYKSVYKWLRYNKSMFCTTILAVILDVISYFNFFTLFYSMHSLQLDDDDDDPSGLVARSLLTALEDPSSIPDAGNNNVHVI